MFPLLQQQSSFKQGLKDNLLLLLTKRWTFILFTLLTVLATFLLYAYEMNAALRCNRLQRFRLHAPAGHVALRRTAGRELRNIIDDLHAARRREKPPAARTMLALRKILRWVDPSLAPLPPLTYHDQQTLLKIENSTEMEVCPEVYQGPESDPLYHTSAFSSTCSNNVPLGSLLTLALDSTDIPVATFRTLLQDVIASYKSVPLVIAVASSSVKHVVKNFADVKIVLVTTSTPVAVRWTRLLKIVTTKYILVGRRISAFSTFSNLERLVRVLRMAPDAAYVAGAVREESGHWRAGCYHSRLELYGLTLRKGYTSSDFECMYCDAVDGPFLSTTALLVATPLDLTLPSEVTFHDWFLRVRAQGKLGLSCPDVMFFVTSEQQPSWDKRKAWGSIARKWGVTHVHLPNLVNHHFICNEAGLICGQEGRHLVVPPCCLARLGRELRGVVGILKKFKLRVHLEGSTVDGGVKGGLQPIRAEAHIATTDNHEGVDIALTALRSQGFQVEKGENKFHFRIHSGRMNISLHLRPVNLTSGLPTQLRDQPTLLYVGGDWLPAPPNPGLFARGSMGHYSLRHLAPWEEWPSCPDPGHHACLDLLPEDGTLTGLH